MFLCEGRRLQTTIVYRNEVFHSADERTQVLQDVASDPTLPRTNALCQVLTWWSCILPGFSTFNLGGDMFVILQQESLVFRNLFSFTVVLQNDTIWYCYCWTMRQLPGEKEWHCSSCSATLTVATVCETEVLIVLVKFFRADPPIPQSQSGYHASCYAMWSFANIFRQFMNPKIKEWTKNLQSGVAASIAFNHSTQWRTIYWNLKV